MEKSPTLRLFRAILDSLRPWADSTATNIDNAALDVFEKVLDSPVLLSWLLDSITKESIPTSLGEISEGQVQEFQAAGISEEQLQGFMDLILPYVLVVWLWFTDD